MSSIKNIEKIIEEISEHYIHAGVVAYVCHPLGGGYDVFAVTLDNRLESVTGGARLSKQGVVAILNTIKYTHKKLRPDGDN